MGAIVKSGFDNNIVDDDILENLADSPNPLVRKKAQRVQNIQRANEQIVAANYFLPEKQSSVTPDSRWVSPFEDETEPFSFDFEQDYDEVSCDTSMDYVTFLFSFLQVTGNEINVITARSSIFVKIASLEAAEFLDEFEETPPDNVTF